MPGGPGTDEPFKRATVRVDGKDTHPLASSVRVYVGGIPRERDFPKIQQMRKNDKDWDNSAVGTIAKMFTDWFG